MRLLKQFAIFSFGGLAYGLLEIIWRGSTHISMFFVGGLCFWAICLIDASPIFDGNLFLEAPFCALFVTAAEFCSGVVVNMQMHLNVWDYSEMPFNLWGQICLPFSAIWLALSVPAALAGRGLKKLVLCE